MIEKWCCLKQLEIKFVYILLKVFSLDPFETYLLWKLHWLFVAIQHKIKDLLHSCHVCCNEKDITIMATTSTAPTAFLLLITVVVVVVPPNSLSRFQDILILSLCDHHDSAFFKVSASFGPVLNSTLELDQ